jgi:hypothetical protein
MRFFEEVSSDCQVVLIFSLTSQTISRTRLFYKDMLTILSFSTRGSQKKYLITLTGQLWNSGRSSTSSYSGEIIMITECHYVINSARPTHTNIYGFKYLSINGSTKNDKAIKVVIIHMAVRLYLQLSRNEYELIFKILGNPESMRFR